MPPKAPTRGRGRGRGRGGAAGVSRAGAATAAAAGAPTSATDTDMTSTQDAPPIQSTEPPGQAPVAQMTSSGSATPAATPAPSNAPTPSASSAVPKPPARTASLRGRPAASATPGPSTRGAKKAVVPAPKAVRRSKADREAAEIEERKRRANEAREALRAQRKAGRGRGDFKTDRGRGGKARGGFMGDRERGIRDQVASGPFSAGQVAAEGSFRKRTGAGFFSGGGGGGYSGGGGGGGGSGGARIKSEGGGMYGGKFSIQPEDGGYISSDADEENEGPRLDVDIIDLLSDGEDNTRGGASTQMLPMRVARIEHREREKPVNADTKTKDAANETADAADTTAAVQSGRRTPSPTALRRSKPRARDVEVTRTQRKWRGAWSDSEDSEPEVRIKPEPMEDEEPDLSALQPMDTDIPIKESSSPESKRKSAKARVAAKRNALPTEAPAHQTFEEKREWERHHLDLEIIRQELGELILPTPAPPPAEPKETNGEENGDAEGDTAMTDAAAAEDGGSPKEAGAESTEQPTAPPAVQDRRADRVYLFQFPPILPDLQVSSSAIKPEPPASPELHRRTKPFIDPSSATATDPINVDTAAPASTTTTANKNSSSNPIKVEEGSAAENPYAADFPSGHVGKLRVHASGRTTLDWGGTSMQVGMGTDVSFLQDVIVARFYDEPAALEELLGVGNAGGAAGLQKGKAKDIKKEDDGAGGGNGNGAKGPGGEVMGLGQVRGKFVVTPDWEEIVGQRI